jgi:hypothetical protein
MRAILSTMDGGKIGTHPSSYRSFKSRSIGIKSRSNEKGNDRLLKTKLTNCLSFKWSINETEYQI